MIDWFSEDILSILEQVARKKKREYEEKCPHPYRGGDYPVHIGLWGTFKISVDNTGNIMRITCPDGTYLDPSYK